MSRRKPSLIIAAILAAVMLGCSTVLMTGGYTGPEKTVQKLIRAIDSQNLSKISSLFEPETASDLISQAAPFLENAGEMDKSDFLSLAGLRQYDSSVRKIRLIGMHTAVLENGQAEIAAYIEVSCNKEDGSTAVYCDYLYFRLGKNGSNWYLKQ